VAHTLWVAHSVASDQSDRSDADRQRAQQRMLWHNEFSYHFGQAKIMSVTRRKFIVDTACTGAGIALAATIGGDVSRVVAETSSLAPYFSGKRMAATPATFYRAYRSKAVASFTTPTWIQIDLGRASSIDAIQLFPASERNYPGKGQYYAGEGFPLRFRIDGSDDPSFANQVGIADFTQADFPDPGDSITEYAARGVRCRYVRLTATHLRAVKMGTGDSAVSWKLIDSPEYTLTLAKISVISSGRDLAVGCPVTADAISGNPDLLKQLTRPEREDGETVRRDNLSAVTDPATWNPMGFVAQAPRSGVTLHGGLFQTAMENNIQYLLDTYSTDELLRQFYERTGKITNFKPAGTQGFWEEDLAGSNAGRFLMGAGNSIRWIDHPELRRRLNVVVDGIEECRQPNGYVMAYPEDSVFYSERAGYARAWLTHGLLEAGYAGNQKALPMLRGFYDWFNGQDFLPLLQRGTLQGGQGMIANTRMATSPVGKPEDVQIVQRYYQEDGWLKGLARREKEQIWQYPYDRPHCYLLTSLEAYLDMFLVTGDRGYREAALGAWELYRAHWQQAGGSFSIIEFKNDPPDSNYLHQKLGELCGSSFWVFLSQRFQLLNPGDERFAAEIEKSIYNVAIANQDGGTGIRYHTVLDGKKEDATHHNSCCEGQGTRLLGSLPEHIYSIAPDGIYVNLYEPSTIRWQQAGHAIEVAVETRFPFANEVRATVKTPAPIHSVIHIRVPSWAPSEMSITVNGKPAAAGRPGNYVALSRLWDDGDSIAFMLPVAFQVKRYNGEDQIAGKVRYSIEYGPILLAVVGAPQSDLLVEGGPPEQSLAALLEPIEGSPIHFRVRGNPTRILVPYWEIANEEFTCFPTVSSRA